MEILIQHITKGAFGTPFWGQGRLEEVIDHTNDWKERWQFPICFSL